MSYISECMTHWQVLPDADIVLCTPHLSQALALPQQGREWLGVAALNLAA